MSEDSRRLLDDFWEYLGFLANGVLFLLVGFSVNVASLLAYAGPVVAASWRSLLARALVIGLLGVRLGPWHPPISAPGASGALLGRPARRAHFGPGAGSPGRRAEPRLLVAMAFGVVLFTLVVQGLTLAPLLRALGLAQRA